MIKVKGHSNLFKTENGAVVLSDPNLSEEIRIKREEKAKIQNLESRLDRIENLLERLIDNGK